MKLNCDRHTWSSLMEAWEKEVTLNKTEESLTFSSLMKISEELTKDPFIWKVAFWNVTLNGGSGGLMQAE